MNKASDASIIPQKDFLKETPGPYKDLYIYYIDGVFNGRTRFKAHGFIGNWEEDGYSFLFFENPADGYVNQLLCDTPGLKLIDSYQMTWEEWLGGKVTPFNAGCFRIIPPWIPENGDETPLQGVDGRHVLKLHPGVVFGTGTHPTTGDCLKAVQIALTEGKPRTAIDLGAGTGILSIAAAKMNNMKILAVDLNLLAAKTTEMNIRLNGLEKNVLALQGNALRFIGLPSDLLIANIHYDVMKHLISDKGFLNKKQFILSGLLRSEAKNIIETLKSLPVSVEKTWETEGVWHTIYGTTSTPKMEHLNYAH